MSGPFSIRNRPSCCRLNYPYCRNYCSNRPKAQVLYIYGEKELNCVKASARLFQQLHPNTILYESKGYNHGYLSAYLPQEWIDLVVPFLKSDPLKI